MSESGVCVWQSVLRLSRMEVDEARWSEVQSRSRVSRDFVYGVTTTRVFCLPGCPARRPRRENVRFFETPNEAREAGFRPCLRCRPEQAEEPTAAVSLRRVVVACRGMVASGGPLSTKELERLTGCGARQLVREFSASIGVSPRAFGNAVRTGEARRLLRKHDQVIDAIFAAGFGSVRGFYETASPTLGMTPKDYAAGATGQPLRWTTAKTNIGEVLAVTGALGLAAVRIGDQVQPLFDEVLKEFPQAAFVRDDDGLSELASALRDLADGRGRSLEHLPVDLRGTAFQAKVWQALRRIPVGQTRSYTEVATEIGAPTAVRAVANACASNRLALVVPCHRVVRTDGKLGGYRWGLAVKQALIDSEKQLSRR